jgi:hypothetical protein
MGSIPTPTKRLDALLPKPPKENLCSHFILGEIIDHIDTIHPDFPEVKVPLLKSHLWDVRNQNVSREVHLRRFLKVFEDTEVFKAAFKELDDGMKMQLKTFIAGGGEEVVWAAGGKGNVFDLPPSPPVKHHFKEFAGKIKEKSELIFHHEEHAPATNGSAVNGGAVAQVANGHTNGYVKKIKEDLEKVLDHHGHHGHSFDSTVGVGDIDRFAVKEPSVHRVTDGHVETVISSTAGFPRIFEDEAGTKTMEVRYQCFYFFESDTGCGGKQPACVLESARELLSQIFPTPHLSAVVPCHIRSLLFLRYFYTIRTNNTQVYENKEFQNWGQSVRNTPLWTFIPKTVLGLRNLVKWAKIHGFRVRCGGYRHSWSSTFSQDKQILVSLLNLEEVTKLPDAMSIEPEYTDPHNELKSITLAAPTGVVASQADKALVRVGVSVTNEEFRRWAVHNDKWTLPVDVILVE